MSKLVKDSLLLTFSKGLQMMVEVITIAVLSRKLTLEEYGVFGQILAISLIITSLLSLGIPNSVNYFLSKAQSFEEKKLYCYRILFISNVLGLIGFLFGYAGKEIIANLYKNNELSKYFIYFSLLPWLFIVSSLRDNVFIALGKAKNAVKNRVLISVFKLIFPVLVAIYGLSFDKTLTLYLIVELIVCVYVLFSIKRVFGRFSYLSLKSSEVMEILKFSLPLGLSLAIGMLNIQVDKLLISRFFTIEEVGIYTNMSKELPITAISASFIAVIMPKFVKLIRDEEKEKLVSLWNDSLSFIFYFLNPMILFVLLFNKEIIILLYSEKYLMGKQVFLIYTIVMYTRIFYFGSILNASGNTRKILKSILITFIINFILSIIFILLFGFAGPAYATLVSLVVLVVYQLFETSKILNINIKILIPFKKILIILFKDSILFAIFHTANTLYPYIKYFNKIILFGFVWQVISFWLYKNYFIKTIYIRGGTDD